MELLTLMAGVARHDEDWSAREEKDFEADKADDDAQKGPACARECAVSISALIQPGTSLWPNSLSLSGCETWQHLRLLSD